MGRGFFVWASSVLLGCSVLLPSAVGASTEFEVQLPQVFLEGINFPQRTAIVVNIREL